ncbi:MAG: OmpP1/FadL family transporter [Sandaracinaceae bacterium]
MRRVSTEGPSRVARYLAMFIAALAASASARGAAQDYNPRLFPVGEEALTLGGAFTGRASDASAAYYNPAGLTFGSSGSVGLSLALNVFDRYRVEGVNDLDVAFDVTDTQGVPFFAGASTQFGDGQHAVAAATLAPRSSRRRFLFGGDEGALDVARQDSTRWYGVAYSYRPLPWLSLGLGAFVAVRRMEHRETEIGLATPDPEARFTETRLNAEKLILRFGALVEPVPQLRIGLSFQAPAIVLGARANYIGTNVEDGVLRIGDRGAQSPLPWELRLGAAWQPTDAFVLTADLALSGPIGSADDPVFLVDPDGDGNPAELLTQFLEDRYHTDPVLDFAIGGRVMVADMVPIAAGVFSSFSAAPVVPDTAADYAPDRVHRVGATLSAGYVDSTVNFSLGVMAAFGFGAGLVADESGMGPLVRTPIESQTVVVFLSGAVGAALQVGRRIVEDVVTPMLDLDAHEDEEEDTSASPEQPPEPIASDAPLEAEDADPVALEVQGEDAAEPVDPTPLESEAEEGAGDPETE